MLRILVSHEACSCRTWVVWKAIIEVCPIHKVVPMVCSLSCMQKQAQAVLGGSLLNIQYQSSQRHALLSRIAGCMRPPRSVGGRLSGIASVLRLLMCHYLILC